MRFSCPCCETDYAVPIAKIPRGYYKVVCSHCDYKWHEAMGETTNFSKQIIAVKKNSDHGLQSDSDKAVYRAEVLAILREEAALESQLRGS